MESKIRQYFVAVSDDSLKLVRALVTDKQEGTWMPLMLLRHILLRLTLC